MITAADLIAAGYRAYAIDNRVADDTAYFKWFCRDDGSPPFTRLYTIQVTFWYFDKHFGARASNLGTRVGSKAHLYYAAENTLVGETGFTLEASLADTATVAELEAFYARAYYGLGCVPDLHNQ